MNSSAEWEQNLTDFEIEKHKDRELLSSYTDDNDSDTFPYSETPFGYDNVTIDEKAYKYNRNDSLMLDQQSNVEEELVPLLKYNEPKISENNYYKDSDNGLNFVQIKTQLASLSNTINESIDEEQVPKKERKILFNVEPIEFIENIAKSLNECKIVIDTTKLTENFKYKNVVKIDKFESKRLGTDCFWFKWSVVSKYLDLIIGYEVYIDNYLYQRIRTANKTNLVVFSKKFQRDIGPHTVKISIIPLSCYGQQLNQFHEVLEVH